MKASWVVMSLFYSVAGTNHFINPATYLRIMPPYLPQPLALVYVSGAAEVVLGLALWSPALRPWAAWGLIALLVAVFPANLYMYQQGGAAFGLPSWAPVMRLPLQAVLIAWAYAHTRPG